jgi:hypothetical protein
MSLRQVTLSLCLIVCNAPVMASPQTCEIAKDFQGILSSEWLEWQSKSLDIAKQKGLDFEFLQQSFLRLAAQKQGSLRFAPLRLDLEHEEQPEGMGVQSFLLSQPLNMTWSAQAQQKRLEAQKDVLWLQAQKSALAAEFWRLGFAWADAQEHHKLAREAWTLEAKLAQVIQQRVAAGQISPMQFVSAQLRVDQRAQDTLQTALDARVIRVQWGLLMGDDGSWELPKSDILNAELGLLPRDSHSTFVAQNAEATKAILQAQQQALNREAWPSLVVAMGVQKSEFYKDWGWKASLGVEMPWGSALGARKLENNYALREHELEVSALQRRIDLHQKELWQRILHLQSQRKWSLEKQMPALVLQHQNAIKMLAEGRISIQDVLEAQKALLAGREAEHVLQKEILTLILEQFRLRCTPTETQLDWKK